MNLWPFILLLISFSSFAQQQLPRGEEPCKIHLQECEKSWLITTSTDTCVINTNGFGTKRLMFVSDSFIVIDLYIPQGQIFETFHTYTLIDLDKTTCHLYQESYTNFNPTPEGRCVLPVWIEVRDTTFILLTGLNRVVKDQIQAGYELHQVLGYYYRSVKQRP